MNSEEVDLLYYLLYHTRSEDDFLLGVEIYKNSSTRNRRKLWYKWKTTGVYSRISFKEFDICYLDFSKQS